jgi:hypothetical protein
MGEGPPFLGPERPVFKRKKAILYLIVLEKPSMGTDAASPRFGPWPTRPVVGMASRRSDESPMLRRWAAGGVFIVYFYSINLWLGLAAERVGYAPILLPPRYLGAAALLLAADAAPRDGDPFGQGLRPLR